MSIGKFYAGIAALICSANNNQYLLLRRSEKKDYAPRVWECVTGRVDQGEGFEDALHREVREELGVEVQVNSILGTTHFYRGAPIPENELLGVVYLCSIDESSPLHISEEHAEYRWLAVDDAMALLTASDPSTQWIRRVIQRAEILRTRPRPDLGRVSGKASFELG